MRFDLRSLRFSITSSLALSAACGVALTAIAQETKSPDAAATDTKSDATAAGTQINPQEQLDKGDAAIKEGDFKAAYKAYNDLATAAERAASPEAFAALVKAQTGRGNALIGLKQFDAAEDDFRKVLDSDPGNVAALIGRGKARLELNKADLALKDFQDAAKADQTNGDAQFGIGKSFVTLGHSDEAVEPLTQAIAADPKNAEAYRLRGTAYAGQVKNKEAIDDLNKSIELNPDDHESYFTLGMVYMRAEQYKEAVEQLAKAIEHYKPKPGHEGDPYVQGYLTLSSARIELGKATKDDDAARKADYKAAAEDCDKLLKQLNEKNPAHAQVRAAALYSRGVAERMQDNYGDAVKSFSQAIEANPELGDAYFRRGICLHNLGEEKMAIADFEQAAHITYDDPRCNLWEGFTYAKLGQYNDAIRAYGDAIAASDRYAPAYANRALAYMMLGEYDKAVNDYNSAIRLTPAEAKYYFQRGIAYEMQKDWKRASASFATSLEFDNKNSEAYRHMATAMQNLGKNDLATEYNKKADETAPKKVAK